jgi:hypothetical protein
VKPATTLQRCFGASLTLVCALAIAAIARAWPILRQYPHIAYTRYAEPTAYLLVLSVVNLTCWLFLLCRYVLLKETGRKLAHFEKQLTTGETVAQEIARRFQQP